MNYVLEFTLKSEQQLPYYLLLLLVIYALQCICLIEVKWSSLIFFYNFWGLWMNVGFLTVEIRDIAVGLHCSYNMLSRVSSFLFYWALPIYIVSGDVWNHLTCFYLWLNCFLICHHSSRACTKWCEENKASEKIS